MIESRPIPALAQTALAMLNARYQADLNTIGQQTVAALGLSEDDNWTVDFAGGVLHRVVPDPGAPASPPPARTPRQRRRR